METLLKPSEMRFELLCAAFQTFCPELEGELVELKPGPRKTLEEIRFQHVLDFCHDVGIFDEGDEIDMMKIKGESREFAAEPAYMMTLPRERMLLYFVCRGNYEG